MATTKVGVSTVGDCWAYCLNLWTQFATGTYTTWAYALSTLNSSYSVEITVGLSGGGTDLYKVQILESNSSDFYTLTAVFSSAGFRTMPQVLLPATVPGGTAIDIAYGAGPIALRVDLITYVSNASDFGHANYQHSTSSGIQVGTWVRGWKRGNLTYWDVIGMMWNAGSVLVDTVVGMPTDLLGNAPLVVQGASSSPDFTSIVDALNNIATMDADYTFNQEGVIYSMRGMVRVT